MKKKPSPTAAAIAPAKMPDLDSILAGLVALVVYLVITPHVSGDKDASEFTLVLATLGVAHPTGYPLYTLLGSLFVHAVHALGANWSFAANAWSAVGGAFSIGFFHALIARLLPPGTKAGARRWIPLTAIAILFLNPIWTVETTLAEVYSWHCAWAMGLSCLFVSTLRRLAGTGFTRRDLTRRAAGWGFLCGVGLAHHATSVLLIAPLSVGLLFALVRAKRLRIAPVALAVAASLVPLTAYFWVVWRAYHPGGFMWPTLDSTPASIFRHLTGGAYTGYLGSFSPSTLQRIFLKLYVYPFLFPAMALAALAAWRARRLDDRVARWSFVAAAGIGTTYAFFYGVSDPSSYFLHPLLLSLAGSALLLDTTRVRVAAAAGAVIVVLSVVLSVGWVRVDIERKRQFVGFNGMLHDMWNSIPFDTAFVFWRDDMYVRLHEYQVFQREKPNLMVIHPSTLTQPAGRRRFTSRFGFDPLAGLTLDVPAVGAPGRQDAIDRLFDDIEHNVNRHSSLPVIHFDPAIPTVRLLKKESQGADSVQTSPTAPPR